MPWQLGTEPIYIAADDTQRVELTNSAGSTVYYGSSDEVNEAENEGSLTANQKVVLKKGTYVISGGQSFITTRELFEIVRRPELEAHSEDETDIHGIVDTSVLATGADIATHVADTTAVHGIADTSKLPTDADLAHVVNAQEEGAVADADGEGGGTDATEALQAAIDKAIELGRPLYLPPGKYRTTAALKADTRDFNIFGAGSRFSVIVPDDNSFDTLTIGPGEEGSGRVPAGYARDFGISGGGGAEVAKAGIESTTGKAAFKLNGLRHFDVTNVCIEDGVDGFDIGFDFVNNSHGNTFRNCVAGMESCRVGLNLRDGGGSGAGSDNSFYDCWFNGEVAAVVIGKEGGGYQFHSGQLNSSLQASENDDQRGTVMVGLEYLTGEVSAAAPVDPISFYGMDFENSKHCWFVRAFEETSLQFQSCRFNGNSEKAIGVFKSNLFRQSQLTFLQCRIAGEFSNPATELLVRENENSSCHIVETGTSGTPECNGEGQFMNETSMVELAGLENAVAFSRERIYLNGTRLRTDGGVLELSPDGGKWHVVSLYAEDLPAKATLSFYPGTRLIELGGETVVTKIEPTVPGDHVTIVYLSAGKIVDGENLNLAGDFEATEGDTLTLICDGESWFEVGRSAN